MSQVQSIPFPSAGQSFSAAAAVRAARRTAPPPPPFGSLVRFAGVEWLVIVPCPAIAADGVVTRPAGALAVPADGYLRPYRPFFLPVAGIDEVIL